MNTIGFLQLFIGMLQFLVMLTEAVGLTVSLSQIVGQRVLHRPETVLQGTNLVSTASISDGFIVVPGGNTPHRFIQFTQRSQLITDEEETETQQS